MSVLITRKDKVSDIFERYPQTQSVFARFGFHALCNPILRKILGRFTSVERGCELHAVALEPFLEALNQAASRPSGVPVVPELREVASQPSASESPPNTAEKSPSASDEEPHLNEILQANVADITREHPEVGAVFTKHFGGGCFCCPAFGMETVQFACLMHQTDPVSFARECLEIIDGSKKRI